MPPPKASLSQRIQLSSSEIFFVFPVILLMSDKGISTFDFEWPHGYLDVQNRNI
ncbi:hypothetical protein M7I_7881 [Glarea lozoyensis 74030]|uniref:Uncharacterized protein n=1 Tax=Glarea lozoyensis (strain ATCC 74030 / MF5533) TaxID=1104152 RepID=H0EYH9_GLAL7|nr:hypothetical protein M7I_7881 [Glarea lozoyensis 74030]